MADSETEAEYKQRFIKRVKDARIARALKQWEMADALGMPQDKYKQYETRTYLPNHLIRQFCYVCRIDAGWLVTGQGKMMATAPVVEPEPPSMTKPKKAKKAA